MNCREASDLAKTFERIKSVNDMTEKQTEVWAYIIEHKNVCQTCQTTYQYLKSIEEKKVEVI